MAWDREAYRREVLEPARQAGNVPAGRTCTCGTGCPATSPTRPRSPSRSPRSSTYWRELRTRRQLRWLGRLLIAQHAELERAGPLTPDKLAELHARRTGSSCEQARAGWREAEASAATHVGPDTVARLRSAAGPVRHRRRGRRGAAARPASGSSRPSRSCPPRRTRSSAVLRPARRRARPAAVGRGHLRRRRPRGFRVLGGFRLADGQAARRGGARRGRAARRPRCRTPTRPRRRPRTSWPSWARPPARPGELDALLLSEVTERLRQFAGRGFVAAGHRRRRPGNSAWSRTKPG